MKILTEMKLGICYSSLIEKTNVKGLGQADKRLDMFVTANEADICVPYLKVLQYMGGHDLFSIGRRRSPAVSTADIPLVSQGAFFQHIHASEPEH